MEPEAHAQDQMEELEANLEAEDKAEAVQNESECCYPNPLTHLQPEAEEAKPHRAQAK